MGGARRPRLRSARRRGGGRAPGPGSQAPARHGSPAPRRYSRKGPDGGARVRSRAGPGARQMTITRAGLVFSSALVLLGVVVAAPTFVLVGLLGLLALGVSRLWSRFGLRDLHYERSIGRDRTLWGDDVSLDIAVWNDKPLPLPWLSVDDFATGSTIVREESLVHTDLPGLAILRSRWTVGSYERVVRHLTIAADRRGMYALGT